MNVKDIEISLQCIAVAPAIAPCAGTSVAEALTVAVVVWDGVAVGGAEREEGSEGVWG